MSAPLEHAAYTSYAKSRSVERGLVLLGPYIRYDRI
jgi:hypothetical protein